MTKRTLYIGVGIMLVIVIMTSPFWLWILKPGQELDMLIIDKTVPDKTYREHKGIIWLLNHLKFTKEDNQRYDVAKDYVGFIPSDNSPDYTVRDLPKDISNYDMIYIADNYGVYEEEYLSENLKGERAKLIYGGMTSDEINTIEKSLYENNQTFIAEFNTFASPTKEDVKEKLYNLLGLDRMDWQTIY